MSSGWSARMKAAKEAMSEAAKATAQSYNYAKQTVLEKSGKVEKTSESDEVTLNYGQVEETRGQMTRTYKAAAQAVLTGRASLEAQRQLSVSIHSIDLQDEKFREYIRQVADKMSQLEGYRHVLLEDLENTLHQPFRNFVKTDIREARHTKTRHYDAVRINLDAEKASRKSRNIALDTDPEFAKIKEHFQETETETTNMLMDLNERKEVETMGNLLSFLEAEQEYHQQCLALLQSLAPHTEKIKEHVEAVRKQQRATKEQRDKAYQEKQAAKAPISEETRVFGKPLDVVLARDKRTSAQVPVVIEHFFCHLGDSGALEEEGIFRLSGMKSTIGNIHHEIDRGNYRPDLSKEDPHVVSGLLKAYLRELPEPLMTFKLYPLFIQAGALKDDNARTEALKSAVAQLPAANLTLLTQLMALLVRTAKSVANNKMGPLNLAVVFGPNMLYSLEPGTYEEAGHVNTVIKKLIEDYEKVFPPPLVDVDQPKYMKQWAEFVPKKVAAKVNDDADDE